MFTQIYVNTHVALIFLSIFISVRLFLDDYMYTVCCLPGIHSLGHNEDNLIGRIWERKACIGKPSFEDEEKTLPKALRTQALTALTSNFGLVQYA